MPISAPFWIRSRSQEMHEAALFTFAYVFGHVRSTTAIETLLGAATGLRLSA